MSTETRDPPAGGGLSPYDVALLPCGDYAPEVLLEALVSAARAGGMPDARGKVVLVKPNLLKAASPEKAVTTHPEFLRAAIRLLKAGGAAKILVGDSPAFQGSAAAARAAGFWDVAREEGAEWVDFGSGPSWPAPKARLVKSFGLAAQARDCDLILNLPKLKTHRLMLYTGAIKNLLGLVPGLGKSSMHLRFPDRGRFGTMLVDLASALPKVFSLMDAVVAMEGEGPGDGDPRHLGLVLASREPAWLDWTAAGIIGYDPGRIPYLVDALERTGRNPASPGLRIGPADFDASRAKRFALLPYGGSESTAIAAMPGFARPLLKRLLSDRPIFLPEPCIGCSACVGICPAGALDLRREAGGINRVRIDDDACITCFCCHEVCPAHAIRIGRVPFRRRESRKPPAGGRT